MLSSCEHNSRTCLDSCGCNTSDGGGTSNGIMLFGVRVTQNSMRKSASMTSLSHYEQTHESINADITAGYASDDLVHASSGNHERKRGTPWTEEEHRLFLLGLQKVGKGDWRGISRNFVKTRTPTQVASHAQKYFLRRNNFNRRRRRSSLFDISTDEEHLHRPQEMLAKVIIPQVPHVLPSPSSSTMAGLSLNQKSAAELEDQPLLTLMLSINPTDQTLSSSSTRLSDLQVTTSHPPSGGDLDSNGGSTICVA